MFKILCMLLSLVPPADVKWGVLKGGMLRVNGTTNVNKFSCVVKDYSSPDTLVFYQNKTMSGAVRLPVPGFDCMSAPLTEGLRKALNAKEFPFLTISFLSLDKYPALQSTEEMISGIVSIELAGKTKKVAVHYRIFMDHQQVIHLTGKQSITFSAFGLTPPRKLGGMIRTDDQLDVEFYISLKAI